MNEIDKKAVLKGLQELNNNMTDEQAKSLYREIFFPREKIRTYLATMTLSEIEEECQVSEQDIYYWADYYKLNVPIYDKRTYSGGLVPKNTEFTGWFNIKHKDELNKENGFVNDDEEQLLEQRLKDTKHDFQREMLKYNQLEARIKSLAQEIERLKILKKAFEEAKKNNDWLSYVEETRFGKRPEVKELPIELLTDEIVFDYLVKKHGIVIPINQKEEEKE